VAAHYGLGFGFCEVFLAGGLGDFFLEALADFGNDFLAELIAFLLST